jgi:hypothetical protein
MLFRRRSPLTPPSADAAFGHISQRHDDTTHDTLAPSAPFTKHTKLTKATKKSLIGLVDGLQPLAPPRFARWQE